MRWITACNGSAHTIREAERILATMDIGTLVPERIKTVAERGCSHGGLIETRD
jgi:hypothetical protein